MAPLGNRPGPLRRKLATAARLPAPVLLLLVPCWVLLGLGSALIAVVPYRRLSRLFGRPASPIATVAAAPGALRRAEWLRQAIGVAARMAPFRADCYPQGLAVALLARVLRVPTLTRFGARFTAGTTVAIEGHCWVSCGDLTICGGASSTAYYPTLACFVRA